MRYLEELEGIEMTFEGLQKLNFVEAALVIQVDPLFMKLIQIPEVIQRQLSSMLHVLACALRIGWNSIEQPLSSFLSCTPTHTDSKYLS